MPDVVNLAEQFGRITQAWSPRILADVNDCQIKLTRLEGEFDWHHHEAEDEFFLVVNGRLCMRLRDGDRWLEPGEGILIPHGVEHCPVAPEGCDVLLFEPRGTLNTGNIRSERTRDTLERI